MPIPQRNACMAQRIKSEWKISRLGIETSLRLRGENYGYENKATRLDDGK